jgi:hypothetical protein
MMTNEKAGDVELRNDGHKKKQTKKAFNQS